MRQLEVHDVRQLADIQSARGDVGRHQHANAALLEILEGTRARTLRFVAMDRGHGKSIFFKAFGQSVGPMLGAREDQTLAYAPVDDQTRQQRVLAGGIDVIDAMIHQLGGRIARCDVDDCGIHQPGTRERADLLG